MNVWFSATEVKCEVLFKVKLALYEEACVSLVEYFSCNGSITDSVEVERIPQFSLLENMLLAKPLKMPKPTRFIDAIEEQLHNVFNGLDNGYTINDVDRRAFEHARFSTNMDNTTVDSVLHTETSGSPQLYGELTSKGVRQLFHIVLQCIERVGTVTQLSETQKKRENEEEKSQGSCQGCFHSIVAIDIGSGTGKLLFEWSLLARQETSQWSWTHVGLELAPSRMHIARCAMRKAASLAYCSKRGRWCVDTSFGDEEEVKIVLGEADVFAPSLLSNETFFSIATDMMKRDAGLKNSKKSDQHDYNDNDNICPCCHIVVFCCGLGFSEPAVCELCGALERMWLTPYMSSSWQSLTCVFLLRAFAELRSFPLFRLCTETVGQSDNSFSFFYAVKLNTTWMSEAPAWVLSLRRI